MKLWSVDNLKAKRWPSFSWEGYDEQSERPFRHIAKCKRKRVKKKILFPIIFFFNDCSTFHNPKRRKTPTKKLALLFTNFYHGRVSTIFFFSPSTTFRAFFCWNPRMQWRTQPPFICHQIKQLPLKQYFERKKKGKGGPSFFLFFLFCCC